MPYCWPRTGAARAGPCTQGRRPRGGTQCGTARPGRACTPLLPGTPGRAQSRRSGGWPTRSAAVESRAALRRGGCIMLLVRRRLVVLLAGLLALRPGTSDDVVHEEPGRTPALRSPARRPFSGSSSSSSSAASSSAASSSSASHGASLSGMLLLDQGARSTFSSKSTSLLSLPLPPVEGCAHLCLVAGGSRSPAGRPACATASRSRPPPTRMRPRRCARPGTGRRPPPTRRPRLGVQGVARPSAQRRELLPPDHPAQPSGPGPAPDMPAEDPVAVPSRPRRCRPTWP